MQIHEYPLLYPAQVAKGFSQVTTVPSKQSTLQRLTSDTLRVDQLR